MGRLDDKVALITGASAPRHRGRRLRWRAPGRQGVGVPRRRAFAAPDRASARAGSTSTEGSGLASTIVTPVFMQNLLGMVRNRAIYTAAGDGRLAMVGARDVAAVAVAALTSQGHEARIYTLTGPEGLSFDEGAEILSGQTRGARSATCGCLRTPWGMPSSGIGPSPGSRRTWPSSTARWRVGTRTSSLRVRAPSPVAGRARFRGSHATVRPSSPDCKVDAEPGTAEALPSLAGTGPAVRSAYHPRLGRSTQGLNGPWREPGCGGPAVDARPLAACVSSLGDRWVGGEGGRRGGDLSPTGGLGGVVEPARVHTVKCDGHHLVPAPAERGGDRAVLRGSTGRGRCVRPLGRRCKRRWRRRARSRPGGR